MSVHRPVRNLVRRLILNPQHPPPTPPSNPRRQDHPLSSAPTSSPTPPLSAVPPDSEFVTLLETLAIKLMRDPSLIGFFLDDIHFEVLFLYIHIIYIDQSEGTDILGPMSIFRVAKIHLTLSI